MRATTGDYAKCVDESTASVIVLIMRPLNEHRCAVRLSTELRDAVKAAAVRERRTFSDAIRIALEDRFLLASPEAPRTEQE